MEGSVEVKVIQVIEARVLRGRGSGDLGVESPIREVVQYFSMDGTFLAEVDPCLPVRYVNGRGVFRFVEGGQAYIEKADKELGGR